MIAHVQPFEGRVEKERLANLLLLKNVAEICLKCFENSADYCKQTWDYKTPWHLQKKENIHETALSEAVERCEKIAGIKSSQWPLALLLLW